jgi:hypothetical protein
MALDDEGKLHAWSLENLKNPQRARKLSLGSTATHCTPYDDDRFVTTSRDSNLALGSFNQQTGSGQLQQILKSPSNSYSGGPTSEPAVLRVASKDQSLLAWGASGGIILLDDIDGGLKYLPSGFSGPHTQVVLTQTRNDSAQNERWRAAALVPPVRQRADGMILPEVVIWSSSNLDRPITSWRFPLSQASEMVRLTPDGELAVTISRDGWLKVWHSKHDFQPLTSMQLPGEYSIEACDDAGVVFVSTDKRSGLVVWELTRQMGVPAQK